MSDNDTTMRIYKDEWNEWRIRCDSCTDNNAMAVYPLMPYVNYCPCCGKKVNRWDLEGAEQESTDE